MVYAPLIASSQLLGRPETKIFLFGINFTSFFNKLQNRIWTDLDLMISRVIKSTRTLLVEQKISTKTWIGKI